MKLNNILEVVECFSAIVFNPDILALNESSFHFTTNTVEQNALNTTHNSLLMYDQLIDVQCEGLKPFYKEHNVTNVDEKWTLLKLPHNTTFDFQADFTSNDTSLWSLLFPSSDYLSVACDSEEMFSGKLAFKNISIIFSQHQPEPPSLSQCENMLRASFIHNFSAKWHCNILQNASGARYILTKPLLFAVDEEVSEKSQQVRRRLHKLPLYFNLTERENDEFHVRESYPNYYEMYFEVLRKYENSSTEVLTLTDLCKLAYYKSKILVDRQNDEYFKNYVDRTPEEKVKYKAMYNKMQASENMVFGEFLPPIPADSWTYNRKHHPLKSPSLLGHLTHEFALEIGRKYAHQGHVSYGEEDIWDEWSKLYYDNATYYVMLHWREHCLKEGRRSEKDCLYVRDLVKFNTDYFGREL